MILIILLNYQYFLIIPILLNANFIIAINIKLLKLTEYLSYLILIVLFFFNVLLVCFIFERLFNNIFSCKFNLHFFNFSGSFVFLLFLSHINFPILFIIRASFIFELLYAASAINNLSFVHNCGKLDLYKS